MAREYTETETQHMAIVRQFARKGDLLTYTVCGGHLQEATFSGEYRGHWMLGELSPDTREMMKLHGRAPQRWSRFDREVDDISPLHVTHINRDPVAMLPEFSTIVKYWMGRA